MVNVSENRRAIKWTKKEQLGRVLWAVIHPLFLMSPRPFWAWRRLLLRLFGARIGTEVHVYPTVRIAIPWHLTVGDRSSIGDRAQLYSLGFISIGENVTVSQGAHLCAGTHDWKDEAMPLLKLPIAIGDGAWICADAFIGPNVKVGHMAIVGARTVVFRDVEPSMIVVGNPARTLKRREVRDE